MATWMRSRVHVRTRVRRARIRARLERLLNYRINSNSDDIIRHIITMNNEIQDLIFMGSAYLCDEETKYEILRDSFVKEEHVELIRWVWEFNCPTKQYRNLVINSVHSWLSFTGNYRLYTSSRRCTMVDTTIPPELIESIPRLYRVSRGNRGFGNV